MGNKRTLPVVSSGKTSGRGLGRREMLQGLLAGVGGAALPGVATANAAPGPVAGPAGETAAAKAQAADWMPEFLNAHELETLRMLGERIVPGSVRSGQSDRFLDSLLAVDASENKQRFLTALGAIDAESRQRFGQPFKDLKETEQVEVLTVASTGSSGRQDWVWTPGAPVTRPDLPPPTTTLRDHFDILKGRIASAYYSSEAGLKELGYTGQMFFASFPDCDHPEH
jgi:hypothetical protein